MIVIGVLLGASDLLARLGGDDIGSILLGRFALRTEVRLEERGG